MAGMIIPTAFTAIDRFSGPMRSMGNAVQGFVGRTERLMGRANAAFSRLMAPITGLNNALRGMGLYIGIYSLFRIIGGAVSIFSEFEQANVNLASVMEKSELPLMKEMTYQARLMAVTYGKSASEISSLQYEMVKLGNSGRTVLAMTEAITAGATAFRTSPERAAETFGGIFKAFQVNLEGEGGRRTAMDMVDKMLYVANKTAADFESFATQMPIVSSIASLGNVGYEQIIAMMGATQDLKIHTATASTSVKNMLLDMMKSGDTFQSGWAKFMKIAQGTDTILYAFDKFKKKTVVTAVGLKQLNDQVEKMVLTLQNDPGAYEGLSKRLAIQQLMTTIGSFKLLKSAYQEFILALDDGNGPVATAIKHYTKILTVMLLMAAGSDVAKEALSEVHTEVIKTAEKWLFWGKVILWFTGIMLALKILIMTVTTVISIVKGVIWLATAATTAWGHAAKFLNVMLAANPIGLIIIATALLVSYMVMAINSFHDWGAAALFLLGPLGLLPLIIMTIVSHWDKIVNAFTVGGIFEGIKAIGAMIADLILYPLQQILKIAGNLTGLDWATNASHEIEKFRSLIGATSSGDMGPVAPKVNSTAQQSGQSMMDYFSNAFKGNIQMDINDPGNMVNGVKSDSSWLQPVLSNTNSF